MSEPRTVSTNGPDVTIVARETLPPMLHESVATLTDPTTGEKLEVCRNVAHPFDFQIKGEVLAAEVNLSRIFQELAVHIVKANAEVPQLLSGKGSHAEDE